MNKTELIAAVAKDTELKKVEAEKAINSVLNAVQKALKDGEKVQLIGFGTFEAKKRPARMARNPRTGEEIKVAASKAPTFRASKVFKDELNKKKK
ncbi:MAG: HU family DNA-binding protein [Eubacteriales bacterium]|jgi:DNA-binding protein HU-beta|nr:HU family DNA-binding protein [Eubacteriales bacterium]MDD4105791.1 HU family DNA-binding protein [Eubacteriales bacterium]MDD4711038.1 HU family DNA-binding protein [Eubacteriales bacterium]